MKVEGNSYSVHIGLCSIYSLISPAESLMSVSQLLSRLDTCIIHFEHKRWTL